MFKVVEISINEDGEYSGFSKVMSVDEIKKYPFIQHISANGAEVEHPEFLDNFGEPMDENEVQKFKDAVGDDTNGIYIEWSVEYDSEYWYVEFVGSERDRADVLTMPSEQEVVDDHGEAYEVDLSFLRRAVEKGSKAA
jgi:hydroxymethylpyrimidine pyrophosphatase-like HAD family hydrolase